MAVTNSYWYQDHDISPGTSTTAIILSSWYLYFGMKLIADFKERSNRNSRGWICVHFLSGFLGYFILIFYSATIRNTRKFLNKWIFRLMLICIITQVASVINAVLRRIFVAHSTNKMYLTQVSFVITPTVLLFSVNNNQVLLQIFSGFIGLGTIVEVVAIIQSLYWEGFGNGNGYWLTSVAFRTTGLLVNFITRSRCENMDISSCPFPQEFNHNAVMHVFVIMAAPLYYEAWHSWQGPSYLLDAQWAFPASRRVSMNPAGPGFHQIKTKSYGSTSPGKGMSYQDSPSIDRTKDLSKIVQLSNQNSGI